MMYLKYIILTAVILTSLCGCSQEENMSVGGSDDKVALSLVVPGVIPNTRSELAPVNKEATINNAYFFFYDEDGVSALTLRFPSLEATGEWNSNKVSLPGLKKDVSYTVQVLANVPEETEAFLTEDKISEISIDDLEALTEQLTKRQEEDGSGISFTGVDHYQGEIELKIDLVRTVAKLQVGIDMSGLTGEWQLESVKVLGEMQKTSYIGTNLTTPRVSSYNAFNVTGKDSVYYYLYENAKSANDADQVKLQINIANKTSHDTRSYTAIVNKKGESEIVRNKIYKSKILLVEGSDPVELSLDTVAWDNKYINVDVPNVYLDLPSDIVKLSSTGYGFLNFKSNAQEVEIKWKNKNGLLVNSLKGPSTLISPKDILENYRVDFSMFSVEQRETKDTITLNVGNISKEVVVIKPESDNFLALSVDPLESSPDSVYIYDRNAINNVGITITLGTTNFVKPWYLMSVLGIRKPDGSLDTTQGLPLDRGYLPLGSFTFNMMESFKKGGYSRVGIYECVLRIGYSDIIGDYPHFRVHNFIIEIQN